MQKIRVLYRAGDATGLILVQKLAHYAKDEGVFLDIIDDKAWQNDASDAKDTKKIYLVGDRGDFAHLPKDDRFVFLAYADVQNDPLSALRQTAAPTSDDASGDPKASDPKAARRFVAITACPTGVAHTFMAAEALENKGRQLGYIVEVETQGSVGAQNRLSDDAIAAADCVIVAADIEVNLDRFVGKKIYRTSTAAALKQTQKVFDDAMRLAYAHAPAAKTQEANATKSAPSDRKTWGQIYKHLMTGVSYMLPLVVAGGLLIAMSFVFGINAFEQEGSLASALMQTGKAAFSLMIPILSGYIAYSIADRAGLAAGLIGGMLSATLGAGFLGAIASGFLAGFVARFLAQKLTLPQALEALKPILIIPLLSALVVGLAMVYVVGAPMAGALLALEGFLGSLSAANLAVFGAVLGAMMCVDMGGPVNKAAYTFSVGLLTLDNPNQFAIAAAMAGGMTPAIGMGLATLFAKQKFTADEQSAGKAALALGMCFISEGAIPFAAKDPVRVLPIAVAGGAVAGGLVGFLHLTLAAPHGGVFVLFIPNAINSPVLYLLAVAVGSATTGILYAFLKPNLAKAASSTQSAFQS